MAGHEIDARVALAGPLAQLRSRPNRYDRAAQSAQSQKDDFATARNSVASVALLVAGEPLPEPEPGEVRQVKLDSAIFDATLDRLQRETRAIIDDHWLAVKAVAKALFERDRLDQAEVESLMVAALPHLRRDVSGHLAPTHAQ